MILSLQQWILPLPARTATWVTGAGPPSAPATARPPTPTARPPAGTARPQLGERVDTPRPREDTRPRQEATGLLVTATVRDS